MQIKFTFTTLALLMAVSTAQAGIEPNGAGTNGTGTNGASAQRVSALQSLATAPLAR